MGARRVQYTLYFAARAIKSPKSSSIVKRGKKLMNREIREMLVKQPISIAENKEGQFLSSSLLVRKKVEGTVP